MDVNFSNRESIVQAPLFPTYTDLGNAIRALNGEPVQRVRDLTNAIWEQTGTPQSPVDWSDPDKWIGERLTGDLQVLAHKIWKGSGRSLNPRYLYDSYLFINKQNLLDQVGGVYRLNERGRKFLANEEATLRELDAVEGLPKLLSLIAERSPCKRQDILPAWADYLKAVSLFKTESTFKDTLWRRLTNLTKRGLVTREGNHYAITDTGLQWLKGFSGSVEGLPVPSSKRTVVIEAARAYNEEQLQAFKDRLMKLEAAEFEHFVKALLDAMDYEDVTVTKPSGDKGVDVVAKVQFGITEITEVVQVKRTETTITRPKIDELRGAPPYHKAIRGTINSLGNFAKGAQDGALYVGAAPITLIDGKRLLDLCIKHQVGIKRSPVDLYEIDEAFFAEKFGHDEELSLAPLPAEGDGNTP
jgi:restriction system protein